MTLERTVLGRPIRAEIIRLDEGWDIGIFGGSQTHVGAVTLAEADGTAQTLERPGHKDSFVSARWVAKLSGFVNAPVCVRCGIHYDHATREQLAVITAACEDMLRELTEVLERESMDL